MPSRTHFIPNFEVRSVMLLAALTVGTALAARGQAAPAADQAGPAQTAQSSPRNSPTTQQIDAAFARADTNQDARLSRQETARFPALEARFDQIDTNQDQFVSREEFEAAVKL